MKGGIAVCAAAALLSACAAGSVTDRKSTVKTGAIVTVATVANRCPSTPSQEPRREVMTFYSQPGDIQPQAFPIAAALAPILLQVGVEAAVNLGAQALKEAAEGKVEISESSPMPVVPFKYEKDLSQANTSYPKLAGWIWRQEVSCIIVARGEIGETEARFTDWSKDDQKAYLKDLGFVRDPEFYFEGQIALSDDYSAYRIQPKVFEFRQSRISSMFQDERDVLIAISINKAAAPTALNLSSDPSKMLNGSVVKLENVRPGTVLGVESLKRITTQYVPLATVSDQFSTIATNVMSAIEQVGTAEKQTWAYDPRKQEYAVREAQEKLEDATATDKDPARAARIALRKAQNDLRRDEALKALEAAQSRRDLLLAQAATAVPVNIVVSIAETKDANKFLLALSSALDGQKKQLIDTGVAALKPKTDAEKRSDELKQRALVLTAIQADNAVRNKEVALETLRATPGTDIKVIVKAETDLLEAKYAADTARVAAGLPAKYGVSL